MIIDHSTIMASNTQKRSNILLGIIFISIFLICVLRSGSVGRDIAGYELAYKMTKDVPFSDFNYIYYENGYLLFMKICCNEDEFSMFFGCDIFDYSVSNFYIY